MSAPPSKGPAPRSKMRTAIIVIVISVVAILGAVVYALSRGGPAITVLTKPVTSGGITRQVLATGSLTAARTVEVGSQVSGTILELSADFNSQVKQGQVIARLDPAIYTSRLEAAQGEVTQAQAEASLMQTTLDDGKRKLARAEELSAQGLVTKADLDSARIVVQQSEADLRSRQASIKSSQAGVKLAQVDLDRTIIRSPISGIVVNRNVDVGQTVAATLQSPVLFTIADLRKMNLLTEINEGEIGGVQRGSDVSFQVETLGPQTFHGTVADVRLQAYATQTATATTATTNTATTGAAAPGAVTYTAVIDVANDDGRLAPGGTAIVTLSGGTRQSVVRLPNNALSFRPSPEMLERSGQADLVITNPGTGASAAQRNSAGRVWRFDNNQFVPVDVTVGLSDDQWTEMVKGDVKAGDQLVTNATIVRR